VRFFIVLNRYEVDLNRKRNRRVIYFVTFNRDDRLPPEAKLSCESPITFVMRRHGHDSARAIAGENVVGNPDRDFSAVPRIDGKRAGPASGFFLGEFSAFEVGFAGGVRAVILN